MRSINAYWVHLIDASPAYAWPFVVLLLVFCFRIQVKELIKYLEIKITKDAVLLKLSHPAMPASDDLGTSSASSPSDSASDKTPHIFWAGHDLMFTLSALQSGEKDYVIFGLRQSRHHLEKAGLVEENTLKCLEELAASTQKIPDSEWTLIRREEIFLDVKRIRNQLQSYLRAKYPAYQPREK